MKFSHSLLSVAVAAASLSNIAVAEDDGLVMAAQGTVYVGARSLGNSDDGNSVSNSASALSAKFSYPITSFLSVQLDYDAEQYDVRDDNDVDRASTYGAHLSYRNPNKFLVGVFYGKANSGVYYNWGSVKGDGTISGIEGQYYFDNVTVYAQVANSDIRYDNNDNGFDGNYYVGGARVFAGDDLMVDLSYAQGESPDIFEDQGPHQWGIATSLDVSVTTRLTSSMPLYGSVNFNTSAYDANTEDNGSESRIMLGLSYQFGASSLKENDRKGATLALSQMPSRAASWGEVLD